MRKYLFIFKATLIENFQYVLNIILRFITFFIVLFVLMNLWKYMYSETNGLISGYSLVQMVWYVILTEIIGFGCSSATLTIQMSSDIKSGAIAYSINKPYHYIFYVIAKYLGETVINFTLFFAAGMIIGYAFVGGIPNFYLYQLPFTFLAFLLGIMINAFIRMGISTLSFWIEDSTPFQWVYDKIIIILGIIFPVEMFPAWAQPAIKLSPIYVVTYGPAKLMIDFSFKMAYHVVAVQILYFIITLFLVLGLYQKGVKKLNVNGG